MPLRVGASIPLQPVVGHAERCGLGDVGRSDATHAALLASLCRRCRAPATHRDGRAQVDGAIGASRCTYPRPEQFCCASLGLTQPWISACREGRHRVAGLRVVAAPLLERSPACGSAWPVARLLRTPKRQMDADVPSGGAVALTETRGLRAEIGQRLAGMAGPGQAIEGDLPGLPGNPHRRLAHAGKASQQDLKSGIPRFYFYLIFSMTIA